MDEIRIENLKIYAHHGVFDFEKENGQNFYLNAVFGVELQEAGMTDDLDKTVNYALLCEEMENHMKAHSFDLIEAAAEHLICELFMKGLRDAWHYTHDRRARRMLIALTDWMERTTDNLTDEQMQQMLYSEHGGLNEIFADVAALTNDKRYLRLAHR